MSPKKHVKLTYENTQRRGGVKQIRSRPLPGKHLPIPSRKASRITGHEKLICLALSNCLHIVECLHASRARQLYGVLIVPHCHFVSRSSRWRVCFREAEYALVLSSHHNYVHPWRPDSVLICRGRPCRPSSRLGEKTSRP